MQALFRLQAITDIRLLVPMVTIPDEMADIRKHIADCRRQFGPIESPHGFQLGSMIETPSSALGIERIVAHSDFISIGTNDLIQYVMAASRENPNVAHLYEKGFEYVLPLVERIARVCRENGKECCICGEIANDENYLAQFVSCGVDQFSVSAFRIPHLKAHVRKID